MNADATLGVTWDQTNSGGNTYALDADLDNPAVD